MADEKDDRDSPWKDALDRYLEPALRLLFPAAHAQIDLRRGQARSDAPDRLRVFLLRPNMEGLISTIATCAPGQLRDEVVAAGAKGPLGNNPSA